MDMFGTGFQRLEASMVARERMQNASSSNIANAETPNFLADTRSFADFLAEQQTTARTGKVITTNRMHFSDISSGRQLSQSLFKQNIAQKMDGNNVDIQQEMARMSENQLMHELSMRLIKGKLGGLMNAIKEGR
ncbi:MAG: flagellar basal body rod protein FlgB [Mariprofundus sp.]|nr:flagellar basal body rod protein FlgB [Mariprofundus sp.]